MPSPPHPARSTAFGGSPLSSMFPRNWPSSSTPRGCCPACQSGDGGPPRGRSLTAPLENLLQGNRAVPLLVACGVDEGNGLFLSDVPQQGQHVASCLQFSPISLAKLRPPGRI